MSDRPTTIDECESCQFTTDVRPYPMRGGEGRDKVLCELCAGTHAGSALEYTRQYDGKSAEILQAISYVGNAIIAEIRKRNSGNSSP